MSNKTRPRNLVFAVLIFSAVIIGFGDFSSSLYNNYDVETNETFTVLDRSDDYAALASDLEGGTKIQVTGIDPLDNFIVGAFSTIEFLFSLPDDMLTFVTEAGNMLQLPGEILTLIGIVIAFIVAFTVIEVITKGEM
jgi:hypothetical protein